MGFRGDRERRERQRGGAPLGRAEALAPRRDGGPARRFDRAVYRLVTEIPRGRVATYGQIAALLGAPRAARAVGFALKRLPRGSAVPWHRVINARGGISLRANVAGMLSQRILLEREGVRFSRDRVPLARHRWLRAGRRPVLRLRALGHS